MRALKVKINQIKNMTTKMIDMKIEKLKIQEISNGRSVKIATMKIC